MNIRINKTAIKSNAVVEKSHLSIPSVSRHVLSNFWNAFLLIVSTILPKPTTYSVHSKPVFIKNKDYSNSSGNGRWFLTMPDATLCTDTFTVSQSIRYGLERKMTVSHARHCHSFSIHFLDPFFLLWLHSICSTF